MQSLDPFFARLSRSEFRSRSCLGMKERQYCLEKDTPVIERYTADSVAKRLAPTLPVNDGRQTPMRGHPVFIVQHATATCCRGCLAKRYNTLQGVSLSEEQQRYIVAIIYHWLVVQMNQPRESRKMTKQHSQGTFTCRRCQQTCYLGPVSIDSLDSWSLLADWFSEQFSTGVLIVPCMLTLATSGVLPHFKAEQMIPAIVLIVSAITPVVIDGAGGLVLPLLALTWCAVRYMPQATCLLTFITGTVEIVLMANSVIDVSAGSSPSIPQMLSACLGTATMAICPIMVSLSVVAINSLMKQVALRADFDLLTQVCLWSGLYETLKSPSLKQIQHLTIMLFDIDYFKSINDNYGHECGDKVLSVFVRHIQRTVGDKGLVMRMGGEEFAVAVPSVNSIDGLLTAEKIRKGVELQSFTWQ